MFYSSKKEFEKELFLKFFPDSLKVKFHMDRMLNRISKVYFVIIMIEQIIFIVNDLKLFVQNIPEIRK
jgi:hypothetical protein